MRVHGWDEWQSFRKDRGTPPWIKLHRNLMTNKKWAALSDSEKGQLVSLWIAAADNNGFLPDDPKILRKICMLDDIPNISKFSELGFLESDGCQHDANMTPDGCQHDAPEQRRVEKSREEEKENFAKEKTGDNHETNLGLPAPYPSQQPGQPDATPIPDTIVMFEQLFSIWPAKKKKPQARQAYTIARNRGVTHEVLMAGARRFAKYHSEQKTRDQFLQSLDDWISSDGWTATNGKQTNRKPQVSEWKASQI